MNKVLFLTNIPSPYRVDFFNELGKYIDLTVWYEQEREAGRDSKWTSDCNNTFKSEVLKGIHYGAAQSISFDVVKRIYSSSYDWILIHNFYSITGILAVFSARLGKKKYALVSDGAFPDKVDGVKGIIKKMVISGADAYFSSSKLSDEYFTMFGANPDRMIRYPFTSLRIKEIESEVISLEEKMLIRNSLGIHEEKMVLSVGQFIHRKGFDVLLEAAEKLPDSIGIYIVGGKAKDEYVQMKDRLGVQHVHFIEFMTKSELRKFYMAADLFVLPTREDIWGLVVNEAMAAGVPVVTTNRCIAGLEMIRDNDAGLIIDVDDAASLANAINYLISDDKKREACGHKALERSKEYTIEKMVEAHTRFFLRD